MAFKFKELDEAEDKNFAEGIRIGLGESDATPEVRHLKALANKLVKVLATSKHPDAEEVKDALQEEGKKGYKSPYPYHLWTHFVRCSECRYKGSKAVCDGCMWGYKEEMTGKELIKLTSSNQLNLLRKEKKQ